MFYEIRVEVAFITGHLFTDPEGQVDGLILASQLHLRKDKALVLPAELVHLPTFAVIFQDVTNLFNQQAEDTTSSNPARQRTEWNTRIRAEPRHAAAP